ncbi:hypothetical protein [Aquisalimonas sp.]|uniref:hypothetical protein n=1 Tax=unclassified Aquisalimonas TaxID=2644645 RepID=UPI0025BD16BA|nr:hypothetical protein [Aquisalimonas sp.]
MSFVNGFFQPEMWGMKLPEQDAPQAPRQVFDADDESGAAIAARFTTASGAVLSDRTFPWELYGASV